MFHLVFRRLSFHALGEVFDILAGLVVALRALRGYMLPPRQRAAPHAVTHRRATCSTPFLTEGLPAELLLAIAQELDDLRDVAAFVACCQTCRKCGMSPLLWQRHFSQLHVKIWEELADVTKVNSRRHLVIPMAAEPPAGVLDTNAPTKALLQAALGAIRCNAAFYELFRKGDADGMAALWARDSELSSAVPMCRHPGPAPGIPRYAGIRASWYNILRQGRYPDAITAVDCSWHLDRAGHRAAVTLYEQINPSDPSRRIAAVNAFARMRDGTWRMTVHDAGWEDIWQMISHAT